MLKATTATNGPKTDLIHNVVDYNRNLETNVDSCYSSTVTAQLYNLDQRLDGIGAVN